MGKRKVEDDDSGGYNSDNEGSTVSSNSRGPNGRSDSYKSLHKEAEKRRRDKIASLMDKLCEALNINNNGEKMKRLAILEKTVDHIKRIKEREKSKRSESGSGGESSPGEEGSSSSSSGKSRDSLTGHFVSDRITEDSASIILERHVDDVIFIVDCDGTVLKVCGPYSELFGYTEEDILRKSIFCYLPHDDSYALRFQLLNERERKYDICVRFLSKSGAIVWLSLHGCNCVLKNLGPQKVSVLSSRIYSKRSALGVESNIESFFNETHCIRTHSNGVIIFCSKGLVSEMKLNIGNILGKHMSTLFVDEDYSRIVKYCKEMENSAVVSSDAGLIIRENYRLLANCRLNMNGKHTWLQMHVFCSYFLNFSLPNCILCMFYPTEQKEFSCDIVQDKPINANTVLLGTVHVDKEVKLNDASLNRKKHREVLKHLGMPHAAHF